MSYRIATIKIQVPTYKNVEPKEIENGKIYSLPMTYDVKGMIRILESQLATYISTERKVPKQKDSNRYEEALFLLHELKKFYILDEAGVEVIPEEIQ